MGSSSFDSSDSDSDDLFGSSSSGSSSMDPSGDDPSGSDDAGIAGDPGGAVPPGGSNHLYALQALPFANQYDDDSSSASDAMSLSGSDSDSDSGSEADSDSDSELSAMDEEPLPPPDDVVYGAFEPGPYSDGESAEVSKPKRKEYYVEKVNNMLNQGGSSAEEEASEDIVGDDEDVAAGRRFAHLRDLKHIARMAKPPTEVERAQVMDANAKRQVDWAARAPKRRKMTKETQEKYQKLGHAQRGKSFAHNRLLRRSFKEAIPKALRKEASPKAYTDHQGKIRKAVIGNVKEEMEELDVGPEDFSDQEDLKILKQVAAGNFSNDKTKKNLYSTLKKGLAAEGTSGYVEFHHLGYKSGHGFEGASLNPKNLVSVHGERERNDPAQQPDPPGMHEYLHQATGHKKNQWSAEQAAGGHFNNLDAEAVRHVITPLAQPHKGKRATYEDAAKYVQRAKKQKMAGPGDDSDDETE